MSYYTMTPQGPMPVSLNVDESWMADEMLTDRRKRDSFSSASSEEGRPNDVVAPKRKARKTGAKKAGEEDVIPDGEVGDGKTGTSKGRKRKAGAVKKTAGGDMGDDEGPAPKKQATGKGKGKMPASTGGPDGQTPGSGDGASGGANGGGDDNPEEGDTTIWSPRALEHLALLCFTDVDIFPIILKHLDLKTAVAFLHIKSRDKESGVKYKVYKQPALLKRLFLQDEPRDVTSATVEQSVIQGGEHQIEKKLAMLKIKHPQSPGADGKISTPEPYQLNPLLFAGQPALKKCIEKCAFYIHSTDMRSLIPAGVAGPMYQVDKTKKDFPYLEDEAGEPLPEEFTELLFHTHFAKTFIKDASAPTLEDHLDEDTTLVRSFITKPAVKDVEIQVRASREHKNGGDPAAVYYEKKWLHRDAGVKMGDVFEMVMDAVYKHHHAGARIGQHIVYEIRFPRGMRVAMGDKKELFGPMAKSEFDEL